MKLLSIGNRVIVEDEIFENKTASGLYIPANNCESEIVKLKVYSVGSDVRDINIGDYVVVSKKQGIEYIFNSKKYLIFEYENIYAKEVD